MTEELIPFCECGCGLECKPRNRFLHGHNRRGAKHSDESKLRISSAQIGVPNSPETCAAMSKAHLGVPRSPEICAAISAGRLNSDAVKAAAKAMGESQRGGHDIINHHYLYDDADLSKYTMPMTRSEHTTMHNRMRADGYEVPHINSVTDDNGLWGYKSW